MKPLKLVPTCVEAWKIRNGLRNLLPGERQHIGGVWVAKVNAAHKATRYLIGTQILTFEAAIAYIENPPPVQPAITLVQLSLGLEEAS